MECFGKTDNSPHIIEFQMSCYCYLRVLVIQIKMGKRNNSGGKRDKWETAHTIAAVDEVRNKEMSIRQVESFQLLKV